MSLTDVLKEVERVEREFRLTTETLRLTHSALEGAKALLANAEAELAQLREALKLAEFMLTKDSLCQSERLEEGLTVIRRARNAGGNDAE